MGWRVTTINEIQDYLSSMKNEFDRSPDLQNAYANVQAEINKIDNVNRELGGADEGILQALDALREGLSKKRDAGVIKDEKLVLPDVERRKIAAALFEGAKVESTQSAISQTLDRVLIEARKVQVAMPATDEIHVEAAIEARGEAAKAARAARAEEDKPERKESMSNDSTLQMTKDFAQHRREEKIQARKEDITKDILPGKERNKVATEAFEQTLGHMELKDLILYRAEFYNQVLGGLIKKLEGSEHADYRHNEEFIKAKNALINDHVFSVMQTLISKKADKEKLNVPIFEVEKMKATSEKTTPENTSRGRSGFRRMIDRVTSRSPSPKSREINEGGLDNTSSDKKPRPGGPK